MAISNTARNSLPSQNHKHQVGNRIHNLSRIDCSIVVLNGMLVEIGGNERERIESRASSHQLMVEVTGPQYPGPGGG